MGLRPRPPGSPRWTPSLRRSPPAQCTARTRAPDPSPARRDLTMRWRRLCRPRAATTAAHAPAGPADRRHCAHRRPNIPVVGRSGWRPFRSHAAAWAVKPFAIEGLQRRHSTGKRLRSQATAPSRRGAWPIKPHGRTERNRVLEFVMKAQAFADALNATPDFRHVAGGGSAHAS